ncbi:MAG: aldo/keto reductase [Actinomycetaceae bacterium]
MTHADLTLNNGVVIPAVGFGVFQAPPEETTTAVAEALRVGYRHVDTAAAYGNERGVGEAIAASGSPREELFVETKVWITDYGYDETIAAVERARGYLGVDTIDLVLLHQPLTTEFERTIQAYKALEKIYADGAVRAIGVSNFMVDDLTTLLDRTDVVPAVNQIELHPYFQQRELVALGREHGVAPQAWSPIGGVVDYEGGSGSPLHDPTIAEIAAAHGRTPAQVMLRWHIQKGVQVIPKSVRPERIAENFDVFGFELTSDELAAVDALETGVRSGPVPASITLQR